VISVIIPTADRPGPLHRALRSLSRRTFRDFEGLAAARGEYVAFLDDDIYLPAHLDAAYTEPGRLTCAVRGYAGEAINGSALRKGRSPLGTTVPMKCMISSWFVDFTAFNAPSR